jgi:hypothetical protein
VIFDVAAVLEKITKMLENKNQLLVMSSSSHRCCYICFMMMRFGAGCAGKLEKELFAEWNCSILPRSLLIFAVLSIFRVLCSLLQPKVVIADPVFWDPIDRYTGNKLLRVADGLEKLSIQFNGLISSPGCFNTQVDLIDFARIVLGHFREANAFFGCNLFVKYCTKNARMIYFFCAEQFVVLMVAVALDAKHNFL